MAAGSDPFGDLDSSIFDPGLSSGNLASASPQPGLIQSSPDSNTFNWNSILNTAASFGTSLTNILTRPSAPTTPLVLAPGQQVTTLPNGQPVISSMGGIAGLSLGTLLLLGIAGYVIFKLAK